MALLLDALSSQSLESVLHQASGCLGSADNEAFIVKSQGGELTPIQIYRQPSQAVSNSV